MAMSQTVSLAALFLLLTILQSNYAFPSCFQERYESGCESCCEPCCRPSCEPVRSYERPVSYLPVPQPLPIRVPIPKPSYQPPSVTIPNIILALLPPTHNKVCAPPSVKPFGLGRNGFNSGYGFGHGYGKPSPLIVPYPLPQPYVIPTPCGSPCSSGF